MHWIDQSGKQYTCWRLLRVNNTSFFEDLRSIQTPTNTTTARSIYHI